MSKFNLFALAVTALTLNACSGKEEAQKVADALTTVSPAPVNSPNTPANPTVVKWTGNGTIVMTGSPQMPCDKVSAEILDDANGFELRKFSYDCSGMTADMDSIRLQLRGTELFLGADKVGSKENNVTAFDLHDPSGATLGFRFETAADALQVKHTMKANGFEETLNATLKR